MQAPQTLRATMQAACTDVTEAMIEHWALHGCSEATYQGKAQPSAPSAVCEPGAVCRTSKTWPYPGDRHTAPNACAINVFQPSQAGRRWDTAASVAQGVLLLALLDRLVAFLCRVSAQDTDLVLYECRGWRQWHMALRRLCSAFGGQPALEVPKCPVQPVCPFQSSRLKP